MYDFLKFDFLWHNHSLAEHTLTIPGRAKLDWWNAKGPRVLIVSQNKNVRSKNSWNESKYSKKKKFLFREIDFISIHEFSKLNFLKDSDLLWEETKSVTKIYIFSTPTGSLIWQNIWRIGIGRSKGSGMVGPSKGRSKLWWGWWWWNS